MRKYLYLIKKKKIKSWLKFWLLTKDQVKYILSEILEGFSFNLQNTVKKRFKIFNIFGNSVQNGTPTPENPVPINSVADDVNLFDISKITTTGAITNNGDGTITITNSYSTSTTKKLSVLAPNLKVGDTYILNLETTVTNKFIYLYGTNESWDVGTTRTITQSDLDSYVFVYGENNQTVTISGIKIAKGTTLTPCSPYNQGTVTIKQRGKNLIDNNNLQYDFSNVPNTYNQLETIETGIRYSTTYSSGTPMIIFNTGIDLTSHIGKTIKMKSTISSNAGSIRVGIANADISLRQYKANTNISNEEISFLVTDDLGEKKYLIYYLAIDVGIGNTADFKNLTLTIDEEPIYEPYQGNDYTFQTEPLRSLPNGVRDSLEADGIHRKIVIQTGTLTETTTITLSDAKTNGAYMCNIKPSGTLTGKTIELEAGDYEIIYELETEIIEPYTEEQQAEYDKIKELYTFNGTTNIYSDDQVPPYLKIQYYMKGE